MEDVLLGLFLPSDMGDGTRRNRLYSQSCAESAGNVQFSQGIGPPVLTEQSTIAILWEWRAVQRK